MNMGQNISFDDFLNILKMDEQTYILALRSKLQKPTIFLKWNPKDIHKNAYRRLVGKLWQSNTNTQFILDLYVTISYCTSYVTKIDKNVTQELHTMLEKCKIEKNKSFLMHSTNG